MAELAGAFAADGKDSLVRALAQKRGQEDSGANQPAAEAPALISAHPATRPVPHSSIPSADAGELTIMTDCSCVDHDD